MVALCVSREEGSGGVPLPHRSTALGGRPPPPSRGSPLTAGYFTYLTCGACGCLEKGGGGVCALIT